MGDVESDAQHYARLQTINTEGSGDAPPDLKQYTDEEKGSLLPTSKFQTTLAAWRRFYMPRRYVLCAVGFLGFVNIYGAPPPQNPPRILLVSLMVVILSPLWPQH